MSKIAVCEFCLTRFKFSSHQKRGRFCSNACNGLYARAVSRVKFHLGELVERHTIKQYLAETTPYECKICRIGPVWNGMPMTLHLDHIDGFANNNLPSNLRFLCLHCHSQTESYGAKNKGKGRKSLGLPTR